jgi:hypothetical protein
VNGPPAESDSRVVGDCAIVHGHAALILGKALSSGPLRRELELCMARESLATRQREEVADAVQVLWAAGVTWRLASGNRGSPEGQADVRQRRSGREVRIASPFSLSAREAAGVLGVSDRRVRQLAGEGRFAARKGRRGRLEFDAAEVEAERQRREAAA